MPTNPLLAPIPLDTERAVQLGIFIQTAYNMYNAQPPSQTQNPPTPFIDDYKFIAWIQMKDFVVTSGDWQFYGLIAQRLSSPNEYVLAIRGTGNLTEWLDDAASMVLVPLPNWGQVAYGFNRIYQTLRVVDASPSVAADAKLERAQAPGTFAQQVAATLERHAAPSPGQDKSLAQAARPPKSLSVTGHSLGAALATLYVAENAASTEETIPLVCTFASPRVGDTTFAQKFDELSAASWRIVNELDVVPKVPFIGFTHVGTEYVYNSSATALWTLSCWHSLSTYLNLLDPKQPLSKDCRLAMAAAAVTQLQAEPKLIAAAAPAASKDLVLAAPQQGEVTISITIKTGPSA